jgi:hypothetical protein
MLSKLILACNYFKYFMEFNVSFHLLACVVLRCWDDHNFFPSNHCWWDTFKMKLSLHLRFRLTTMSLHLSGKHNLIANVLCRIVLLTLVLFTSLLILAIDTTRLSHTVFHSIFCNHFQNTEFSWKFGTFHL